MSPLSDACRSDVCTSEVCRSGDAGFDFSCAWAKLTMLNSGNTRVKARIRLDRTKANAVDIRNLLLVLEKNPNRRTMGKGCKSLRSGFAAPLRSSAKLLKRICVEGKPRP